MHTTFFFIATGIAIFIAIVNFLQYFINKDKAYLFYALYTFISALATYQVANVENQQFSAIATTWFITFLQRLNIIAYLMFSIAFFKGETAHDRILKIWTNITQFFVFLFLIELIIFAFDGNHALLWKTQSYFTILRFTLSLVCIYNIRYIHSPLRSFYLVGTLLLWIGVLIGKIFPPNWVNPDILYLNPYFYHIALFMFENVCFTIGLSHRSNLILIQKQEQINQERLEKEQIRNHIAADLHDDLGAGLSTIRLLGERAQFSTNFDEKNNQIEKMTEQAQSLIEKMSTIIWAMNSEKDTIESLVQYLRFFAFDYLQDTHTLKLQFPVPNLPPSVSEQNLTGDTRREVFLTVKEALHNIVKHAQTSCVLMSIQLKNNDLEIIIKDNGKGLKVENSIGNGLKNMAKRMNKLGGDFQISTNDTTGVNIVLSLPLTKVRS